MSSAPSPDFPLTNKKVTEAIVDYARHAQEYLHSHFSLRDRLEEMDRAYQREEDMTNENRKAKLAVRAGDKRKRMNITVPVLMPQVESALGYFAEVFCTGYPVFGVGTDPEFDDAALQMETIIGENSITAGWIPQMLMWARDGYKYNIQCMEVNWDTFSTPALETDLEYDGGKTGKPREVVWEGNCMKRMDMYNTIFDPRVSPYKIHSDGEFAGYNEIKSRIALKRYINNLAGKVPTSVVMRAFESGSNDVGARSVKDYGFYIPQVNPDAFLDKEAIGTFDWMSWATNEARRKIQYRNVYELLTLYARIIPSDFDLYVAQDNTPQVWKFVIVNNKVLLYAERQTNAHDHIPMVFGQPNQDGLDYQTKSFAQNVIPFQDLASAAMNANIASKRKLVLDRMFYDPSRIRESDINNDNSASKIPVRPSAYGKPVGDAFHAVPYKDELSQNLVAEAELYMRYANITNGQNPASQGQFQKGNKTRHEFQDVMGHSNARNKTMALVSEHGPLTTIKDIIRLNILQYQPETELYNRERGMRVKIDPVALRKAATVFKLSDGMLPSDKMLNTEEFQVAAQTLGSTPALSQRYRLEQVFSHLFKQRGVDLRPYEKTEAEIQYEQQLAAWQQAYTAISASLGKMAMPDGMDPMEWLKKLQEFIQQSLPPMPQSPNPEIVKQQMTDMAKRRGSSLASMIAAVGNPAPGTK
jgi:hypothetical protein